MNSVPQGTIDRIAASHRIQKVKYWVARAVVTNPRHAGGRQSWCSRYRSEWALGSSLMRTWLD